MLTFPTGWDSPAIKEVCGVQAGAYNPGDCSVRWSFVLALISLVDICVLCVLAFVLGSRYVKLLPDQYLPSSALSATGSLQKGELNAAFMPDQMMRKSLGLPPVVMMDNDKHPTSGYTVNHFQL
jgi:hypothetical protein